MTIMATNDRTPGVYIEEIAKFPPSVVAVETAIPAFIGYTAKTHSQGEDLINRPVAIDSLLEFEAVFGLPPAVGGFTVTVDADGRVISGISDPNMGENARFRMTYALRHFYDNGGGRCYIVSIGDYNTSADHIRGGCAHLGGLRALSREDEPTLIVFPDLSGMVPDHPPERPANADEVAAMRVSYHSILVQALDQCATLGDRFLICDLLDGSQAGSIGIEAFRSGIGTRNLKYGAVYHPYIHTTLAWPWNEDSITVSVPPPSPHNGLSLTELKSHRTHANTAMYANIRKELDRYSVILPPAAAVAGIYTTVDRTRGVWKSPANASLASVRALTVAIDNDLNDDMNVHPTGKSVNALRYFSGKGFLVWGARTLAGNDNEWRYVAVRRLFNMVEESVKKTTEPFVFEPNDANTWVKVKAMIENFLVVQWRQGALAGAKPADAFYVRVGLGTTMTAQDILEGRMNVEIGMAVIRPAEFIILRFSHKMQES
jgi:phage tail sheath protein FI